MFARCLKIIKTDNPIYTTTSQFGQFKRRDETGTVSAATMLDKLTHLHTAKHTINIPSAINATYGVTAIKTPKAVATPLPPLNFSQTEHI
jgi:hypothetical protein